jgi:tetratricopeptide (TPR) repeat protein
MWRYWQKRGHLTEARRRLEAIAQQPWSRDDPVLRARLMEALGGVGWWTAAPEVMIPAYGEALEIWESIGDKREISNALYNNSFQYAISRDPVFSDPDGVGFKFMNDALALSREVGDERGAANALWGIGNYRYFKNAEDQGVPYFREALEIFKREADITMAAWSQHQLGAALLRQGKRDEVAEPIREALRDFHAAGDVAGIAIVLDDFASESVAHGDLPRAARLWGAARAISFAGGVGLADFIDGQIEDGTRPTARSMIPEELERYAAEGRAMSVDESVAYALEMPVDQLAGPHDHVGGTPG